MQPSALMLQWRPGQGFAEHMQEGTANVHVVLLMGEQPGDKKVDTQPESRTIGHHMARVGEERQSATPPSGNYLDARVTPGKAERREQTTALRGGGARDTSILVVVQTSRQCLHHLK